MRVKDHEGSEKKIVEFGCGRAGSLRYIRHCLSSVRGSRRSKSICTLFSSISIAARDGVLGLQSANGRAGVFRRCQRGSEPSKQRESNIGNDNPSLDRRACQEQGGFNRRPSALCFRRHRVCQLLLVSSQLRQVRFPYWNAAPRRVAAFEHSQANSKEIKEGGVLELAADPLSPFEGGSGTGRADSVVGTFACGTTPPELEPRRRHSSA